VRHWPPTSASSKAGWDEGRPLFAGAPLQVYGPSRKPSCYAEGRGGGECLLAPSLSEAEPPVQSAPHGSKQAYSVPARVPQRSPRRPAPGPCTSVRAGSLRAQGEGRRANPILLSCRDLDTWPGTQRPRPFSVTLCWRTLWARIRP